VDREGSCSLAALISSPSGDRPESHADKQPIERGAVLWEALEIFRGELSSGRTFFGAVLWRKRHKAAQILIGIISLFANNEIALGMGAWRATKHQPIGCGVRIFEGIPIRHLAVGEDGVAAVANGGFYLRGEMKGRNDIRSPKYTIPRQSGLAHMTDFIVIRPEVSLETANFCFSDSHAAFAHDFKATVPPPFARRISI
jgi:hypothetical protein